MFGFRGVGGAGGFGRKYSRERHALHLGGSLFKYDLLITLHFGQNQPFIDVNPLVPFGYSDSLLPDRSTLPDTESEQYVMEEDSDSRKSWVEHNEGASAEDVPEVISVEIIAE